MIMPVKLVSLLSLCTAEAGAFAKKLRKELQLSG